MARPLRIEYENAVYHVMNRGKGAQRIYHSEKYFNVFLETLADAHERFGLIIHAYCLMFNHYHLLVQTPHGNLSRIMRHINGVYTQKHNRLKKTDGPLFRGRYKAIVVDGDSYLLALTRYIHRNPIETSPPLVKNLEDYGWSSFPAYINDVKAPDWLEREQTYRMLGKRNRYQGYRDFVELGVDEELNQYYKRGNTPSVIGGKGFRSWLYEDILPEMEEKRATDFITNRWMPMSLVVDGVAQHYRVDKHEIIKVTKGLAKGSEARKVAMYLCQQLGDHTLEDIQHHFGLTHSGSVSFITTQIRQRRQENVPFDKRVRSLIADIIKQAT